jgi:hypothetical protein
MALWLGNASSNTLNGEFDSFCSCFGTRFVLRRQPPAKMKSALLDEYKTGVKPVISFKYYGLSSKQQPLYPTCVQVSPALHWNS